MKIFSFLTQNNTEEITMEDLQVKIFEFCKNLNINPSDLNIEQENSKDIRIIYKNIFLNHLSFQHARGNAFLLMKKIKNLNFDINFFIVLTEPITGNKKIVTI